MLLNAPWLCALQGPEINSASVYQVEIRPKEIQNNKVGLVGGIEGELTVWYENREGNFEQVKQEQGPEGSESLSNVAMWHGRAG